MNVLVTGGAGYVGSHTVRMLLGRNDHVVVIDDLSTGHRTLAGGATFVEGDIGDRALVARVLKEHSIEAIIHFAAKAYVGDSIVNPRDYFRNNVANTLALLDEAITAGVQNVIFSSSCTVYGIPQTIPIHEKMPFQPISPYGESKAFVERVLHWYGSAYGLRWTALRYFNAAGANPSGQIGEMHDPEPHLIPRAIQAALGIIPHLDIAGTDYDTPDGTAVRDYVHVDDLARAHALALDRLSSGGSSAAYNLGLGRGYSVLDVVRAVERASGRTVAIVKGPRRAGDPPALVADPTRAERELGWAPTYTTLDDIVHTAWRWHARAAP